jgi:hypothetical protein
MPALTGWLDHIGEACEERVLRIKAEAAVLVCPQCGKQPVLPIFYGLPSHDGIEKMRNDYGPGGYVLGGCG